MHDLSKLKPKMESLVCRAAGLTHCTQHGNNCDLDFDNGVAPLLLMAGDVKHSTLVAGSAVDG